VLKSGEGGLSGSRENLSSYVKSLSAAWVYFDMANELGKKFALPEFPELW